MSDSALGQPGRGRGCYHWQGQVYHGAKAVAAAAGVSLNAVFWRLRTHGNLDGLLTKDTVRYEWQGQFYRTQAEVAAAAGVVKSAVSTCLNRHGHLKTLGIGAGNAQTGRRGRGRTVRIGAREWPSICALARDLGVTRRTVRLWIADRNIERLQAQLMAVDARAAKRGAA
ncbi:helix-turn-helix domain-containing protein [Paracoccus aminophilus]|uniref:Uncharacterized protein n=1 Tax=Paracoccus aminophilus JCM 7686 TaxID=1367847 RepID=S5XSZ7_PARAH|nr:hypothetical protein [Paracoccus aminophilus]AGT09327.1 hypothetical protein JCM7686_2933 [Paracoccus aminophilus JCM 7686]AGT10569.1 hypothetical protein JCM7686_2254 [Paracoccus aminophilus JCM 7686]